MAEQNMKISFSHAGKATHPGALVRQARSGPLVEVAALELEVQHLRYQCSTAAS